MNPYSQYMTDRSIENALTETQRAEKLQLFQGFLGSCETPSTVHLPVGAKLTTTEIQQLEAASIVHLDPFETEYIRYCFLNDIKTDELIDTFNKVKNLNR